MRLRLSLLVVASLLFAFSTFPSVDGCCCPGGYTCGCNFFGCSCVYPVCKADYNYKVSHHTKPVDEYGRRCGANHYKGEKPCDRALDGPLDKFSAIDRDSNEFISMDEAKAMSVLNDRDANDEAIETGFHQIDTNGDGLIEPQEFDKDLINEEDRTTFY